MTEAAPTILCVDDDPDVLWALQEYLAAQGYHAITATNGVEAFLQVSRQRPRAVILDLFMPRLGGLGALDRIRRMDASITVIIISGVEGAVEMIREAGLSVAGTLAKPFTRPTCSWPIWTPHSDGTTPRALRAVPIPCDSSVDFASLDKWMTRRGWGRLW